VQTRVGWVAVSLPDATRSDRIYPLLQNLDLENLAFATLQGTGETLNIEEMNEDELRRLVLINLARLTVKGEWNGLLTAAAGGVANSGIAPDNTYRTGYGLYQNLLTSPIGFSSNISLSDTAYNPSNVNQHLFPMYAAKSGAITRLNIQVGTAKASTNCEVGVYDTNDDGQPTTLLGKATIDVSSTGEIEQTSFSSTITTTRGNLYCIGVVFTDSGTNEPRLQGQSVSTRFLPNAINQGNLQITTLYKYTGTTGTLDATIDLGNYSWTNSSSAPTILLSWD
jgi:hypothetical protein